MRSVEDTGKSLGKMKIGKINKKDLAKKIASVSSTKRMGSIVYRGYAIG